LYWIKTLIRRGTLRNPHGLPLPKQWRSPREITAKEDRAVAVR